MEPQARQMTNESGHEPISTNVRGVWITGAVITSVVIAAYLLIAGMMSWFTSASGGPPADEMAQTDPRWDDMNPLQQLRVREREVLNEFDWVDRSAGIARIPIERAMAIVAEKGWSHAAQTPSTSGTLPPQPAADNETRGDPSER